MNATEASILLHYYKTEEDYKEDYSLMSVTEKEAIRFLISNGLLDSMHTITPRGQVLVEHWLKEPLPEQVWVMVPSV